MEISFDFSPVWWVLLFGVYSAYLLLFLYRKSYKKAKEIKIQIVLAVVALIASIIVEFIAISFNLWNYTPRNWPVALWIGYIGAALLGYQLVKKLEDIIK